MKRLLSVTALTILIVSAASAETASTLDVGIEAARNGGHAVSKAVPANKVDARLLCMKDCTPSGAKSFRDVDFR